MAHHWGGVSSTLHGGGGDLLAPSTIEWGASREVYCIFVEYLEKHKLKTMAKCGGK